MFFSPLKLSCTICSAGSVFRKSFKINRFNVQKFSQHLRYKSKSIVPMDSETSETSCITITNATETNNFDISDDFSTTTTPKLLYGLSHPTKSMVINTIEKRLKCGHARAETIVQQFPLLKGQSISNLIQVIKHLTDHMVTLKTIEDNPWLLTHTAKHIKLKLPFIEIMYPRNINDFVPLLKATGHRLNQIRKIAKVERDIIPGKHRIYYLSDNLKVDPPIIAKYVSTRLFMFQISFENLSSILNVMLKFDVNPTCILRDLWAFRYSPQLVESRLKRAKLGQKDKLMPWMVRCIEPVLAKSIKNSTEDKALLGDNSIVEYISDRLKFDIETTKYILSKHPAVYNVRVTKIKKILDYLLDEVNISPQDIAQNIRVLCHSLKTTKNRFDELKSYDCIPSSLVIVCRSVNEYQKFLDSWINVKNKIQRNKPKMCPAGPQETY